MVVSFDFCCTHFVLCGSSGTEFSPLCTQAKWTPSQSSMAAPLSLVSPAHIPATIIIIIITLLGSQPPVSCGSPYHSQGAHSWILASAMYFFDDKLGFNSHFLQKEKPVDYLQPYAIIWFKQSCRDSSFQLWVYGCDRPLDAVLCSELVPSLNTWALCWKFAFSFTENKKRHLHYMNIYFTLGRTLTKTIYTPFVSLCSMLGVRNGVRTHKSVTGLWKATPGTCPVP